MSLQARTKKLESISDEAYTCIEALIETAEAQQRGIEWLQKRVDSLEEEIWILKCKADSTN